MLADGDYGSIYLSKKFDSPVRIVSENEQGATFKNMVFYGIDNLSLDSITTTGTIKVERNSANVSITNSQLGNAVMFRDTSNVTVENNDISAGNFGLVLNFAKGFTVRNNVIHGATEDLMRIVGGSNNGLMENNVLADTVATKGTHPDLLQLFGLYNQTPHNIVIRGNLFYDDTTTGHTSAQGIFMSDPGPGGGYKNILIEDNLIRTNSTNTIYIYGGQENVVVRNNSLMAGDGDGGAMIRLANKGMWDNSGVTVVDNIAKLLLDETKSSHIGDNYLYGRWSDLSKIFQGTEGSHWEDYLPVSGSDIDFSTGYGAANWLKKLIKNLPESPGDIDGVPETPTPNEPVIEPGQDGKVQSLLSFDKIDFSGKVEDALMLDHDSKLEINQGTIAFSFNADYSNWRRGLFSKDDKSNGDHISIWLQEGHLKASFQDGDQTVIFDSGKIMRANRDYDVVANFSEDGVQFYLNGKLVGESDIKVDWTANHEDMSIGAGMLQLSRTSSPGTLYGYNGEMSDFGIYDHALTPSELAALKAGTLEGYILT